MRFLHSILILVTLLLVVSNPIHGQDSPVITTTVVRTLHEDQATTETLTTITCTDPDNTGVVVSGTTSPSTLCRNCFIVEPINVATGTYQINFYPSVANLDFNTVNEYDITLTCSDGVDPDTTETIQIRLIPNSAPMFANGLADTATFPNVRSTTANSILHTVVATDPDNDPVFYTMTSTPPSNNFEIGFTDGVIRAVNDLDQQCTDQITFMITISDGKINNVGPQVLRVTLDDANMVPTITNLDATAFWPEDTTVGTVLLNVATMDDTVITTLTFTTSPSTALTLFQIVGTQLQLASALDFEDFLLRRPLVLVTATDGGCTSPTYTYTVSVTDVNEPPTILPVDNTLEPYEGNIVIDPEWTTTDPDIPQGDVLTYTIIGRRPSNAPFAIDPDTGIIRSTVEYDVDQDVMTATVTLTVRVTDSGDLMDDTTVMLNIRDANDNAPVFTAGTLNQVFTVVACSTVGSVLGTVSATDLDSDFENNNVIVYSEREDVSGTAGTLGIRVTPGGSIIQSSVFAAGTSTTHIVQATDSGLQPSGPLTSLVPASVTVNVVDCPTTTTTTTTTSSTSTTTTQAPTTTAAPIETTGFNLDGNLWWIILAALLGTAFVGVTAWLCLTRALPHCTNAPAGYFQRRGLFGARGICGAKGPCGRCNCNCSQICKRKGKKPKRKRTTVAPIKGNTVQNINDAFWKERFPDDTYKHAPDRNKKPEPADYEDQPSSIQNQNSIFRNHTNPKPVPAPAHIDPLTGNVEERSVKPTAPLQRSIIYKEDEFTTSNPNPRFKEVHQLSTNPKQDVFVVQPQNAKPDFPDREQLHRSPDFFDSRSPRQDFFQPNSHRPDYFEVDNPRPDFGDRQPVPNNPGAPYDDNRGILGQNIDPRSSFDPRVDPRSSFDPRVDPRSSIYPRLDPGPSNDPRVDPRYGGDGIL